MRKSLAHSGAAAGQDTALLHVVAENHMVACSKGAHLRVALMNRLRQPAGPQPYGRQQMGTSSMHTLPAGKPSPAGHQPALYLQNGCPHHLHCWQLQARLSPLNACRGAVAYSLVASQHWAPAERLQPAAPRHQAHCSLFWRAAPVPARNSSGAGFPSGAAVCCSSAQRASAGWRGSWSSCETAGWLFATIVPALAGLPC